MSEKLLFNSKKTATTAMLSTRTVIFQKPWCNSLWLSSMDPRSKSLVLAYTWSAGWATAETAFHIYEYHLFYGILVWGGTTLGYL